MQPSFPFGRAQGRPFVVIQNDNDGAVSVTVSSACDTGQLRGKVCEVGRLTGERISTGEHDGVVQKPITDLLDFAIGANTVWTTQCERKS